MSEPVLIALRSKLSAYALIDAEDYAELSEHPWYLSSRGYAFRTTNNRSWFMHRDIMGVNGGTVEVDHLNGQRLDNRRANLKLSTHAENVGRSAKWRYEERADEHRDGVLEAFRSFGSAARVSEETGLSLPFVNRLLAENVTTTERYKLRSFGRTAVPDEQLIAWVQEAAEDCGEPLSHYAYTRLARERGWVTDQIIAVRFGSWRNALEVAGVRAHPRAGPRKSYSTQDCEDAVREANDHLGHPPSYSEYVDFRASVAPHLPCGTIVRRAFGGWRPIRVLLLDEETAA